MKYQWIFNVLGVLVLGALGALLFNVFLMPYLLASVYFENFQFIRDLKEGKVVVTKTDQIYIQENIALENAIAKVQSSLVTVKGNYTASGLIVTSDGNIITLADVISTQRATMVVYQDKPVNFKVINIDYKNNLALLKIDQRNLPTVGFIGLANIKLGQTVFLVAASSKEGQHWVANEGIIKEISSEVIKTTMYDSSTVGGSGLFDLTGRLVGLNVVVKDGGIWAIPIDKIQALLGL